MILSRSSLLTNLQTQGTNIYIGAVIQADITITLKLVETFSKLVRSHGKLLNNKMIFYVTIYTPIEFVLCLTEGRLAFLKSYLTIKMIYKLITFKLIDQSINKKEIN